MKWNTCFLCAIVLVTVQLVQAQEEPPRDPIEIYTFPPELVMQNQQAIALSEDQRNSIKKEVQSAQSHFSNLEWDLENELETFGSLISRDRVNEERALALLEKILKLETEIKRTHLILAIRIKNLLTQEQQVKLREIRERMKFQEFPE